MSTKCITPFYVKDKFTSEYIPVPCSKCPPCKKRRTSSWSFRLVKEGERSLSALFVTLTYNTETVPITKNGFMNLDKADVQKFMKRLRKLSNQKLKYYVCGEYGTKRMRPHYHLIIFNADKEKVEQAWTLDRRPLGQIYIGDVNEASIGYTLKYMSKKGKIPMHHNDDRQKEFSLMSKGLGSNYLTEKMIKWHKNSIEERMYCNIKGNKKIAMPRYYKDKIYTDFEKIRISNYNKDKAEEELNKLINELGESYPQILVERHIQAFNKMYKKAEKNNIL
ncbi:MAG: hypothetical protein QM535_21405 [Limnohabitans sp.]|nr:hypothetical protein [Limnohabitans sp.]